MSLFVWTFFHNTLSLNPGALTKVIEETKKKIYVSPIATPTELGLVLTPQNRDEKVKTLHMILSAKKKFAAETIQLNYRSFIIKKENLKTLEKEVKKQRKKAMAKLKTFMKGSLVRYRARRIEESKAKVVKHLQRIYRKNEYNKWSIMVLRLRFKLWTKYITEIR